MEIQPSKNPKFIFWCDLETTGLNPVSDYILEFAYIITEFEWPYKEIYRGHYLVDGIGRKDLLEGKCSNFITTMHKKSGLLEELASNDGLLTNEYINNELFGISELRYGPPWSKLEKDEKVIIGGSSCHFDLSFLRSHFTEFAQKLSYRSFDASALSMYCRSLGMQHYKKEEAHRAMQDIEFSIRQAKECIYWLDSNFIPEFDKYISKDIERSSK